MRVTEAFEGRWCKECHFEEKRAKTFVFIVKLARKRGGECLSPKFDGHDAYLRFQCAKGHIWETVYASVRKSWCPTCSEYKYSLDDAKEIAEQRGGRCLSVKYVPSKTRMTWQCEAGHIWGATFSAIKGGAWCAECYHKSKNLGLDELQRRAKKWGMKCLSSEYKGVISHYEWECKAGHRFSAVAPMRENELVCHRCQGTRNVKKTMEDMHALAQAKKGKCLSKAYAGTKANLLWECKEGHQFYTKPNLVQQGNWCLECSRQRARERFGNRYLIANLKAIAKKNGGLCLSTDCRNGEEKIIWKCQEGHVWKTSAKSVVNGRWCQTCGWRKKSLSLEEMQKIAQTQGGKCLSKKFQSTRDKLDWKCGEGHLWSARANSVIQGTWCPKCAREMVSKKNELTVEDLQRLAKEKGGECLSSEYRGYHELHKWRCQKGHVWRSRPALIKKKSWCPACANSRKGRRKSTSLLQPTSPIDPSVSSYSSALPS